MAYTQTDLDALQASIARGITQASMNGETVTFRSLNEMLRLEAKLKRELSSTPTARTMHRPVTSTGWRS